MSEPGKCELCGEPLPVGEEMFKYHGYSGPCPKPPLQKARCIDCGLPYEEFPLDVVLPDADWLKIHPEGSGGLLCASCIAKRAAELPDSIVLYARLVEGEEDHRAFTILKNVPLRDLLTAWAGGNEH